MNFERQVRGSKQRYDELRFQSFHEEMRCSKTVNRSIFRVVDKTMIFVG
jgi:hypothetical protein